MYSVPWYKGFQIAYVPLLQPLTDAVSTVFWWCVHGFFVHAGWYTVGGFGVYVWNWSTSVCATQVPLFYKMDYTIIAPVLQGFMWTTFAIFTLVYGTKFGAMAGQPALVVCAFILIGGLVYILNVILWTIIMALFVFLCMFFEAIVFIVVFIVWVFGACCILICSIILGVCVIIWSLLVAVGFLIYYAAVVLALCAVSFGFCYFCSAVWKRWVDSRDGLDRPVLPQAIHDLVVPPQHNRPNFSNVSFPPVLYFPPDDTTRPQSTQTENCILCMEDRPIEFFFRLKSCVHLYCKNCFVAYIKSALGDVQSQFPLRCPNFSDGCSSLIHYSHLESLIGSTSFQDIDAAAVGADFDSPPLSYTNEDHQRIVQITMELDIPIEDRLYCPNTNCKRLFSRITSPRIDRPFSCPYCDAHMCPKCWRASHDGQTCESLLKKSVLRRQADETYQLISRTSKRCPNSACQTPITHYRGHACHHISPGGGCPSCHIHFCYACLKIRVNQGSRNCECPLFCVKNGPTACDCISCPDCKEGVPCTHCDNDGRCESCQPNNPT